jgi:hypothetical protein
LIAAPAAQAEDLVAVASKVSNGYARTRLADGSFVPETYTFKEGGYLSGRMADDSIDKMTFESVARLIAGPLAERGYVFSASPQGAQLLIVVFWGTTRAPAETSDATTISQLLDDKLGRVSPFNPRPPPDHQATANDISKLQQAVNAQHFGEKMTNEEDAMMLGFESARDPDLRTYRYFVVLLAYDLPALLGQKKERLLWQTRFSIDEHRNRFDVQLKGMALSASAYFGQDSFGLRRERVPEGRVEIGEVRSLEATPPPPGSPALAPDGAHVAYLTRSKIGLELAIADVDRGKTSVAGGVPDYGGKPLELAWIGGDRVVVTMSGTAVWAYDVGRRTDLDPRTAGQSPRPPSPSMADETQAGEARTLVEAKLPDRSVVVLGFDQLRHRFLVRAADGGGGERFFVYDRANDLLYELGPNARGQ